MAKSKQRKTAMPQMAVVRPVGGDGSRNFNIPYEDAKRLYEEGKLARDLTNGGYCLPTGVDFVSDDLMELKTKWNRFL